MKVKGIIPNFLTQLNLLSGCIAVVLAFGGHLLLTSLFIGFSLIFDFLDGLAARTLKIKTVTGRDLDSLADVISFGLVPAIMVFQLMQDSTDLPAACIGSQPLFPFVAFLLAPAAAYRLALFNNDPRQGESFRGLPTPSAAIFLGSFPLVILDAELHGDHFRNILAEMVTGYYWLALFVLVISTLMISGIRLLSLKFRTLKPRDNIFRYILIAGAVVLVILFGYTAVFLLIPWYIVVSLIGSRTPDIF